ncbi:MAG TPA: hypothetical protein VGD98_16405 [Ktedonobacteraceae bacterium]
MSNEQALLNCTFGWGKTCRLYYDSIEIAGKSYNLKDLTAIQPSYRIVLGVPSARLALSFGLDHCVLRGIADLNVVRLMVSRLQPYCSTIIQGNHAHTRSSRARNLARAQARAWERTNNSMLALTSPVENELASSAAALLKQAEAPGNDSDFEEEIPKDKALLLDDMPTAPIEDTSLTPGETLEAFALLANNLSTYASPLPTTLWQPPHTPRFQPPLHSVHLIPPHQKFDSGSMPIPVVKSSVLPIIHVPVRLQNGECAHYSIGATLCSDRISSEDRATYPLLDQGLMILTNRRVLYIGKRCQFTLAYTNLWYVSLLHTAIALHIEGQFRRIIIEMEHPHEWASRIELLSFTARRDRTEPPTRSVPAVPGLNMTMKRQAVKPADLCKAAPVDVPTLPLLSERAESQEAQALASELNEHINRASADQKTLEFSPTSAVELLELIKSNTPRVAQDARNAALKAYELGQLPLLEKAPTQEIPCQADVTHIVTQEFSASTQKSGLAETPTQALPRQADVTMLPTQEFSVPTRQPERAKMPAQTILQQSTTSRNGQSQAESYAERPGELDDDDDERTIHLKERKLCQLRTVSIPTAVPDRPPDSQTTEKRLPRMRAGRTRH